MLIGGAGRGGNGCEGDKYNYPLIIVSQVQSVFMRNEETDTRKFRVKARLWFDSTGNVERIELAETTGDARLDADVTRLLGKVNVGASVPLCIQPFTVWVSDPWKPGDSGETQTNPTNLGRKAESSWLREK